jgi:hypothetical protein
MLFQVGDKVRHTIKKKGESIQRNYTKKVYTITKIEGKSIFLDELTKLYRQYDLVIAVGNENHTDETYDERNEKDKHKVSVQRRLQKECIIDNKEERIRKRLRREGLI